MPVCQSLNSGDGVNISRGVIINANVRTALTNEVPGYVMGVAATDPGHLETTVK